VYKYRTFWYNEGSKEKMVMKQERLDVRTSAKEKEQFEIAAAFLGVNLSAFMRMSAIEKSTEVLKQHDTLFLSNKARDAFLEALQNPPQPNKELKKAFKEYKKLVERE
jgi:uncharacterized protein (DUF1778 family)